MALRTALSPSSTHPYPATQHTYSCNSSNRSPIFLQLPFRSHSCRIINTVSIKALSSDDIPPNAVRRKQDPNWRGGFSLGMDLGLSRTGLALSKGYSVRPLTVLELRGQKLEHRIMEIAEKEEIDEFIIGLPKSSEGNETTQSNKVRSVAGRFAVRAAERGVNKSDRQGKIDAYAAVMLLERYFSLLGEGVELVLPKQLELQEMLRKGPREDEDFIF